MPTLANDETRGPVILSLQHECRSCGGLVYVRRQVWSPRAYLRREEPLPGLAWCPDCKRWLARKTKGTD